MSPCDAVTNRFYYRVDRRQIAFIKFILEAYDGLCVMTTIEPYRGIIALNVAPGCEADIEFVLTDLRRQTVIEPLKAPPECPCEAGSRIGSDESRSAVGQLKECDL